jgi:sulfite exporter TauE/SafE
MHINASAQGAAHPSAMLDGLYGLGTICSVDTAFQGGLLLGLFAAGAVGSVVHCGPMCGAFVLGQMSERMRRLPAERLCERQRIGNGLLLPYHLGRLTTYAGLGALAAGSVAWFGHQAWFGRLSGVLLVLAALLFMTKALARILPFAGNIDRAPRFWGRMIGAVSRRITRGSLSGDYLLGVTLGFLPCGLLYAAIAAAAASGGSATGAAAMVAFGLGTAPILMVIGDTGYAAGRRWNRGIAAAAPVLMTLNAALLLALAWQRMT